MAKPKFQGGEGSGQFDHVAPKIKEIDPNRINRIFTTDVGQKFFNQIHSSTLASESATYNKKILVLEIREKNLIDQKILRENPSVYFGSGTDFELPICLGAKDILMVDPYLADPAIATQIREKIAQVVGPEAVLQQDNKIIFKTKGDELETRITIIPDWYGSEEYFAKQDEMTAGLNKMIHGNDVDPAPKIERKIFQPPEKVGLVLGYLRVGADFDLSEPTTASLVKGGYVIQDGRPRSLLSGLSEDEREDILSSDDPEKYFREEWKRRGFEYIDIELDGEKGGLTFLKKY